MPLRGTALRGRLRERRGIFVIEGYQVSEGTIAGKRDAYHQSAGQKREASRQEEDGFASPQGVPPKAGGMCQGLYHYPEKTELRLEEGGQGTADQRD
jgi:hypothetical protein